MRWSEQSGSELGREGGLQFVAKTTKTDQDSQAGRQTRPKGGVRAQRERGESARVESGFSPVPAGKEEEEGLC